MFWKVMAVLVFLVWSGAWLPLSIGGVLVAQSFVKPAEVQHTPYIDQHDLFEKACAEKAGIVGTPNFISDEQMSVYDKCMENFTK